MRGEGRDEAGDAFVLFFFFFYGGSERACGTMMFCARRAGCVSARDRDYDDADVRVLRNSREGGMVDFGRNPGV